MAALLQLAQNTFTLQLLLEDAERLIDIVVADENLHGNSLETKEHQNEKSVRLGGRS